MRKKLDHLFFEEYKLSAKTLGIFRIFYGIFTIFILGILDLRVLSTLPNYIYDPPLLSIASFTSGYPGYYFFLILSLLIFFLHFFVLFGYKTRVSSILLTVLSLIGYSFYFSIGKINHGQMVLVWIPLLLGLAGWGRAYSVDSYRYSSKATYDVKGWPVFLLVSILVFGMFSAGLPKLMGGWLDPHTHAVRGHFLMRYYVLNRQGFLAPYFEKLKSSFIWEGMDYTAVIFELSFLIMLFRKKYLQFYVILGLIFHILNLLILNISFIPNIVIYMLLFPYDQITKNLDVDYYLKKILNMKTMVGTSFILAIVFFYGNQQITLSALFKNTVIGGNTFDLLMMILMLFIYCAGIAYKYLIPQKYFPTKSFAQ